MDKEKLRIELFNHVSHAREALKKKYNIDADIDIHYFADNAVLYQSTDKEIIVVTRDGLMLTVSEDNIKIESVIDCTCECVS